MSPTRTINPGVTLTNNTGTTTFSTLNISSVNGTALYANNGGTLVINSNQTVGAGGTITSQQRYGRRHREHDDERQPVQRLQQRRLPWA